MVNYQNEALNQIFHALADPTRRTILNQLAGGDRTVTEITAPLPMSMPAVSKHLDVLEGAGLVQRTKDGRLRHCRLKPEPLMRATAWLEYYSDFWDAKLDQLEHYLKTLPKEK